MINEIIEYALTSLDKEILELELAVSCNIYNDGQFNNLNNKLQSLYDKHKSFRKILQTL